LRFRRKQVDPGAAAIPEITDDGNGRRSPGQRGLTVVGSHTRIRGILKGSGPLLVQGRLEGEVELDGSLIVPVGGSVDAEVEARTLELSGRASGSLKVSEHVHIGSTGSFEGDMATPVLETCSGSLLSGRAVITRSQRGTDH